MTIIFVFIAAYLVNFIWEHLHSRLYANYKGGPITNLILARATLADAVMLTSLAIIFYVFDPLRVHLYLSVPILLLLAIGIEIWALKTHRWQYRETMPVIPVLGTGLTPTVQLALTGFAIYYFLL